MQHRSGHVSAKDLGLFIVGILLSTAGWAADNDAARALLAQAKAAREGLKNYRCSVEYTDVSDYAARKRELEEARRSKGVFPEVVEYLEKSLDGPERKYELQTIVSDSTGRMRITHTFGKYDLDGGRSVTQQMDVAWDGTTNVDLTHFPKLNRDGAVITPDRSGHLVLTRHPVSSFGDRFLTAMDKAIEDAERIDVHQGANGLVQVRFRCQDPLAPDEKRPKQASAGTIDPSKGFTIPQWELTLPNGNKSRFSATFTEINDGIWFPTEGRIEGFFPDGMRNRQTSVKIANVIVNDPNVDAGAFHISLPEGTYVTNRIAGIAYIVGDPSSVRVLGDSTNIGHIVNKGMRELSASLEHEVFIPHMKAALEKGAAFVLDLKTRKLVGVDEASGSQDVLNALHDSGIGDLFWDGDIVVVGDTKVQPLLAEHQESLTLTAMENGVRYTLGEDFELPCPLQVTSRTGVRYHLLAKSISEEGIQGTCKPVLDR